MTEYSCPICAGNLVFFQADRHLKCVNNHVFDQARQGYFNLLPVQQKKSKNPGDSKEMIVARHDFLSAGYYLPLAKNIAVTIGEQVCERRYTVLDLGCGEGYYARQIKQKTPAIFLYGIDISKPAIVKASQLDKGSFYSVASSEHLPLIDHSIDLVLKVYAPANEAELRRVVKEKGLLLTITPGPRHLWQLREIIYDSVREHDTKDTCFDGFDLVSSRSFYFTIIPTASHRISLLQMTPFAWKANERARQKIYDAEEMEIELDFVINVYQKQ
ncbi:MAG: 23S rRNA (guanine(745)-N(1))-methyltransferase [Oceanicoccus sp.]